MEKSHFYRFCLYMLLVHLIFVCVLIFCIINFCTDVHCIMGFAVLDYEKHEGSAPKVISCIKTFSASADKSYIRFPSKQMKLS